MQKLTHNEYRVSWISRGLTGAALALCLLLLLYGPARAQDPPTAAVTTLADVQKAVVLVETRGKFTPPGQFQSVREAYLGTGFLVSPDGLVVTNAHVVNGGSLFKVYLDGQTAPVTAQLLGISECADLAVLDIPGANLPFLAWRATGVTFRDTVYAAGFPAYADGYMLTEGTVRAPENSGDTEWASINQMIIHTALLDHGNSGGPLVDSLAHVVGVNFATVTSRIRQRSAAISNLEAKPIVDQLAAGQDVESIGISGEAYSDGIDQSGIWVISVVAGSPAYNAGIQPGDIVYQMDNLPVGEDGTVTNYCRVLRSHASSDVINVRVIRDNLTLAGQINGAPLAQAGGLAATVVTTVTTAAQVPVDAGYATVQDDTGIVSINVPDTWKDIASKEIRLDSIFLGAGLVVSQNASVFDPNAPTGAVAVMAMLDFQDERKPLWDSSSWKAACSLLKSSDYAGDGLTGTIHTWGKCAGTSDGIILSGLLSTEDKSRVAVELFALLPKPEDALDVSTVLAPLGQSLRKHPSFWDIPSATIVTDILNVRSGPSLDDPVITTIDNGEFVVVFGRDTDSCGWLKVQLQGQTGWISANPEYVSLDRDCAELKVVNESTPEVQPPAIIP